MDLRIDRSSVHRCRELAAGIVAPVEAFITAHSTVSVERAVLRLLGVDGVTADDVPVPNAIVDALPVQRRGGGVALAFGRALAETGIEPAALGEAIAVGRYALDEFSAAPEAAARGALREPVEAGLARIAARRAERSAMLERLPQQPPPLLYVIVASGNIYEDRAAAVAAARSGRADHRGDSLHRAVAARFRPVRRDDRRLRRHLRDARELPHHARGARRSLRAARALRDAHELRERPVHARDRGHGRASSGSTCCSTTRCTASSSATSTCSARSSTSTSRGCSTRCSGIIINTGEDNYLTTADAVEQAPAVLASQFINEAFAHRAGHARRADRPRRRVRDRSRTRGQFLLAARAGAAGAARSSRMRRSSTCRRPST